jgi:hypothetical protein
VCSPRAHGKVCLDDTVVRVSFGRIGRCWTRPALASSCVTRATVLRMPTSRRRRYLGFFLGGEGLRGTRLTESCLAQSLQSIATRRRIILSGTPIQVLQFGARVAVASGALLMSFALGVVAE